MTSSDTDRNGEDRRAWWSAVRLLRSFRAAFAGIGWLVVHEPNAAIHWLATVVVVTVGMFLGLSPTEWGLLALAIGFVWMAEAFNSALEQALNAMHPEPNPAIGRAKDLAAAAVLLASVTAIAIALALCLPRILSQTAPQPASTAPGPAVTMVEAWRDSQIDR